MAAPATHNNHETDAEDRALADCLETTIPAVHGPGVSVVRFQRARAEVSSWYASEIVTVDLSTGEQLRLFLKNFGSYQRPKDAMAARRERERAVYRQLLAESDLGTARYYGSVWDESEGRYWLLLEYVDGTPVRYLDFEHWVAAVRWLGRMHGYFADKTAHLQHCDFLLRHDVHFFRSTADRALDVVHTLSTALGRRLDGILREYDHVIGMMVGQPRTLAHGAFLPAQVLSGVERDPTRVCTLDWELAAYGSGLYDLAFFTDGFKSPRREVLLTAYQDTLADWAADLPSSGELGRTLTCFRRHKVNTWLAQSCDRRFPEAEVSKLVGIAERLSSEMVV